MRIVDLSPSDEESNIADRDRLLFFVLGDAIRRCGTEAENREPGILREMLRTELGDASTQIEEFLP